MCADLAGDTFSSSPQRNAAQYNESTYASSAPRGASMADFFCGQSIEAGMLPAW
jgi:hypothetical protein